MTLFGALRPVRPAPVALAALALAIVLSAPSAAVAKAPWPPLPERGALLAHFGEEHWDDADGLRILPKVVRNTIRFSPRAVTMSGDKSSDGEVENLERWKEIMEPFDHARIPYFAATGNHDRLSGPIFPEGIAPFGDLTNFTTVFADRPYPFGDARPYRRRGFSPTERPPSDPEGASSHYAVTTGPVRWIFIDNSCFSILLCDPQQSPPFPDDQGRISQYSFLADEAASADRDGKLAFVVMHMPTRDDRPGHTESTPLPHTMGEGTAPDNFLFEQAAISGGVDGVFTGHIKGQWQYRVGGVPYFTDGGAGGEVYVGDDEVTGVDSGYWHGFRLVHVRGGQITHTDTVPVFARGRLRIRGPKSIRVGEKASFTANGRQPTKDGPEVVLELRAPDPSAANAATLPTPAFIWSTRHPRVAAPMAAKGDDPRRDRRRQTTSGTFIGRCPGTARIAITSGFKTTVRKLTVKGGRRAAGRSRCRR